ncbi:MAG: hypothetical protein MI749_15795, partial [Desulfovibrionales bacterium]|nr:hypothetical protein [Desulfovibrionales bacterium]
MFLITSAAYLNPEFTSEFGQIPPAFLPVGNKRLYRLQAATLKDEERVVLTLPEHFPIPDRDLDHLDRLGMEVLKIPEGLSLGQSIVTALEKLDYQKGPLSILHGDTLIYDLPSAPRDVITQSRVVDNYDWAVFKHEPKAFIGPMDPQDTGG